MTTAEAYPQSHPVRPQSSRLLSVDVYRGLAVAGMLLVDYPGDEAAGYCLIRHAPWNGLTAADLIFPSFVFLMGISIVLSFSARLRRGESRRQIAWHAVKRSLLLFALGVFLNGVPEFHLATWRIEGVVIQDSASITSKTLSPKALTIFLA
jgi:predicted acyltransferase